MRKPRLFDQSPPVARTTTPPVSSILAALLAAVFLLTGCGSREPGELKGNEGALHFYRLAAEKQNEGDFESAINLYEKALQVDPNIAEAHLDIGIIYDDCLLDKENAILHYKEFLRLEPDSEKAEMVARWIQRAEEEKDRGVTREAREGGDRLPGSSEIRRELERAREEARNLRVENEAYLKTVAALREELVEAKEKLRHLLSGEAEKAVSGRESSVDEEKLVSLARTLDREKNELRERYRNEKGGLERSLGRLKKQLEELKAKERARVEALKRTRSELDELRRARVEKKTAAGTNDALKKKLAAARERNILLERKCRLYIKDNKTLAAKLKETEKAVEELRVQLRSLESAAGAAERARAAPSASHIVAKLRADAEKEKQEITMAYEKKLLELKSTLERERSARERAVAEGRRETARLKDQLEKQKKASARAKGERQRAIDKLTEQFAREKSEMERRFQREREILLSKLGEARRTARATPIPTLRPGSPVRATPKPAARSLSRHERAKTPPTAKVRRYRVARGDTLISIAKRFYGSGEKWKKIYIANRNELSSPGSLRVGQVLVIP